MYHTAFEEKIRASLINEQIDNLLDINVKNPKLASPLKVDKQRKAFISKDKKNHT